MMRAGTGAGCSAPPGSCVHSLPPGQVLPHCHAVMVDWRPGPSRNSPEGRPPSPPQDPEVRLVVAPRRPYTRPSTLLGGAAFLRQPKYLVSAEHEVHAALPPFPTPS